MSGFYKENGEDKDQGFFKVIFITHCETQRVGKVDKNRLNLTFSMEKVVIEKKKGCKFKCCMSLD